MRAERKNWSSAQMWKVWELYMKGNYIAKQNGKSVQEFRRREVHYGGPKLVGKITQIGVEIFHVENQFEPKTFQYFGKTSIKNCA